MTLEFLSDAQVAGYGRFSEVPSQADLERFFVLDDADRGLLVDRRGDHNRLGFVLQATTVRFVGRFLEDPLDVPWPVVEYLADQLGIADASCVKSYPDRLKTAYEHAWTIRDAYGVPGVRGPDDRLRVPPVPGWPRHHAGGRAGDAVRCRCRLAAPAPSVAARGDRTDQIGEHGSGCGRGPDAHPARGSRRGH